MTADQILAWTIAILTSAGTVLMAIKGIMNSKDYREAKEAIIQSKDAIIERKQADIDSLKLQLPSFMADQNRAIKESAESDHKESTKIIDRLQQNLAKATEDKEAHLERLEGLKKIVGHLREIVDKTHRDIARLESNKARLGALFEGKVLRASPPMISVYKQAPFQQNLSPDPETIFPPPENDKTE